LGLTDTFRTTTYRIRIPDTWSTCVSDSLEFNSMSTSQTGYRFSRDQQLLMQNTVERLAQRTGTTFRCFVTSYVDGVDAFAIQVIDPSLGLDGDLLGLSAIPEGFPQTVFAVSDGSGRPIGPSETYVSFLEALSHAEAFAAATVETVIRSTAGSSVGGQTAAPRREAPEADRSSAVIPRADRDLIESFAIGIGRSAHARPFHQFVESSGVVSVGLGCYVSGVDHPAILGSLVMTTTEAGNQRWSVRGVNGMEIPSLESFYGSAQSVLTAALPYFQHMAGAVREKTSPSPMRKVLATLGL